MSQAVHAALASDQKRGKILPLTQRGKILRLTTHTKRGKILPFTRSGMILPLTQSGTISSPTEGREIIPLTQRGTILPLAQRGTILSLTQRGTFLPLTQRGDILPLTQRGKILPLTQRGTILPLTQRGDILLLTQRGNILHSRRGGRSHHEGEDPNDPSSCRGGCLQWAKHAWQFCLLPAHGCPLPFHLHTGRMDAGYPAHLEGFRRGLSALTAFSLQHAARCFRKAGTTRCSISCRSGRETGAQHTQQTPCATAMMT